MKRRTPVSKIMTEELISVNVTNKVSDVVNILDEKKIHHVPVVSGDKLVGMISKTDIDRITFATGLQQGKVNTAIYDMLNLEQIMTSNLETLQASDEIREAAALLAKGKYHALPVLEGDRLAGIVTTTDVINYLLEQY